MIISRTPFRVSFLGGGTDYPVWYRQHGGSVIATTIDKYCYLTCRYLPPFFDHRFRVSYSKMDECLTIDEITHPAAREVLKFMGVSRGVEIHHDGDLPARSGVGSSSAFVVGLLHALHALQGRMVSKHRLATEGIEVEQEWLKESVGSQDQVMAAYGGLNHVRFLPSGEISVRPIIMPADRLAGLNAHLMLFFTGIKRTACEIAGAYVNNFEDHRKPLRLLHDIVEEGLSLLSGDGDLILFGKLLHEAWLIKRGLCPCVSSERIDGMYEQALAAGAVGGKLLGAGGGGFMLLFAPPERHAAVKQALRDLLHVPFKFEFSGSQIVFFDTETEYLDEERQRDDDRPQPLPKALNKPVS